MFDTLSKHGFHPHLGSGSLGRRCGCLSIRGMVCEVEFLVVLAEPLMRRKAEMAKYLAHIFIALPRCQELVEQFSICSDSAASPYEECTPGIVQARDRHSMATRVPFHVVALEIDRRSKVEVLGKSSKTATRLFGRTATVVSLTDCSALFRLLEVITSGANH